MLHYEHLLHLNNRALYGNNAARDYPVYQSSEVILYNSCVYYYNIHSINIGEPKILEALRNLNASFIEYFIELGYDEQILTATRQAFDELLEDLLIGRFEIKGMFRADIGARIAAGTKIGTPIPRVSLFKAKADLNAGSIELLTVEAGWMVEIDIFDLEISVGESIHRIHGLASHDSPEFTYGAAVAVGGILNPVSIDYEYQATNPSVSTKKISLWSGTHKYVNGGMEYEINFDNRSVKITSKFEIEKKLELS